MAVMGEGPVPVHSHPHRQCFGEGWGQKSPFLECVNPLPKTSGEKPLAGDISAVSAHPTPAPTLLPWGSGGKSQEDFHNTGGNHKLQNLPPCRLKCHHHHRLRVAMLQSPGISPSPEFRQLHEGTGAAPSPAETPTRPGWQGAKAER